MTQGIVGFKSVSPFKPQQKVIFEIISYVLGNTFGGEIQY